MAFFRGRYQAHHHTTPSSSTKKRKVWHNYVIFVIAAPFVTGLIVAADNLNTGMQQEYRESLRSYIAVKEGVYEANAFCARFKAASERERISKKMYFELEKKQQSIESLFTNLIISWGGIEYFFTSNIANNAKNFDNNFNSRMTVCSDQFPTNIEMDAYERKLFDPMREKMYHFFWLALHLGIKSTGLDIVWDKVASLMQKTSKT